MEDCFMQFTACTADPTSLRMLPAYSTLGRLKGLGR